MHICVHLIHSEMRIVLDTNVLLMALPRRSPYHCCFEGIVRGDFKLLISNEILSEYLEIIGQKTNRLVADQLGQFFTFSPYVERVVIYYRWQLIYNDPDDNKFVDTAIAGNADYLISNDRHFRLLQKVDFPPIRLLNAEEWVAHCEER